MRITDTFRERLSRLSLVTMAALLFYFVAYGIHEEQKVEAANLRRDRAVAALTKTNEGIVDKLTEIYTQALLNQKASEAAGEAATVSVATITASLKGFVDPVLIQQAIDAAKKAVKATPGPSGPTGPQGPQGQAGANASTTSTAPATSTSTTRPQAATTSSTTTTTTTTRACTLNALGLVKIGC